MDNFIGRKVKVIKDTSEDSPLSDNGWKIGDVGTILMVLNDHPEYNIIVKKDGTPEDSTETLGFNASELELQDA